jgi:dipeptidyl aminopeptidase/acylaminoacyl peptidase
VSTERFAKSIAAHGSWPSPLTADAIARGAMTLSFPELGGDGSAWWLERRPDEGGRYVLVRDHTALTPADLNVRTRVHEYGGGAWLLNGGTVFFSNFVDQRLYRQDPGAEPVAITPQPAIPGALRYADACVIDGGVRLVCVRETHGEGEPLNELVSLPTAGEGEQLVLAKGRDFYSSPRVSPDGSTLCFTCWDHPNMPWDGTELWVLPLDRPEAAECVAGGTRESIWQPSWDPEGRLHWVSDRSGWWQLYREREQLTHEDGAELGYPQWLFGGSTYAFLSGGEIACIRCERGEERLCLLRPGTEELEDLGLPYTSFGFPALRSEGDRLITVAGSPRERPALIAWDATDGVTVVKRSSEEPLAAGLISEPRRLDFSSVGGRRSHAFYYPPANVDMEGLPDERPPLIVQSHGGPTGHSTPELQEDVLFWTSRGIGVVDVNYGGSSGFGRAYRDSLQGQWGIVDTEDCIAAARHLVETGEVDSKRLAIHGGSAGGYTTLCALVFHDVFAAGASYYGVADAETLASDTHKFESRYLDGLIGPYPETAQTWRERSPINYVERLQAAVILFQGLEDEVVPPSQAETMVAALAARGVPHAYLPFAGEQHGFRRAETIVASLEAELSFYAQIFGFDPADEIERVKIACRD